MASEHSVKRLNTSNSNLWYDTALSGVKLKLNGGNELYAHQVVLSNKSGFFYKAFTGSFRVARCPPSSLYFQEANL
ncbi:hypothetical protein BDV97DRAFT_398286 [Delphinella strobiligena]|nr:hypothetical protein BDV97DRAFT_398286 [Delphinella strobiligena]